MPPPKLSLKAVSRAEQARTTRRILRSRAITQYVGTPTPTVFKTPKVQAVVQAEPDAKMRGKHTPSARPATSVIQAGDVPAQNPEEITIAMRAKAKQILDLQVPKLPRSVGHSGAQIYGAYWCHESTGQELFDHLPKMPKFGDLGRIQIISKNETSKFPTEIGRTEDLNEYYFMIGLPVCPKLTDYSRNWKVMEKNDIMCVRVIPSPEVLAIALNLSRKTSEMSVRFGEENRVFTFAALVQMSNVSFVLCFLFFCTLFCLMECCSGREGFYGYCSTYLNAFYRYILGSRGKI